MKITRTKLKEIVREVITSDNKYKEFFKRALAKTGKSIPEMSKDEKPRFFNKINAAWKSKDELNEKWLGDADIKSTGENSAKTIEQLKSELTALKKQSKTYQDKGQDVPDKITKKEHQITFAIRAKQHWPKGTSESINENTNNKLSISDERYYGKNGIIIMINDNGKKVAAIFKNKKNANKYNRNNPQDIQKLLDLASKTKYPNAIDENINEDSSSDLLNQLKKELSRFDWYYERSDDHRAYNAGKAQFDTITNIIRKINKAGLKKQGVEIWKSLAPSSRKNWYPINETVKDFGKR